MIEAGYRIYKKPKKDENGVIDWDSVIYYNFDKSVGGRGTTSVSTSNENNRLELKTFGRTPYVYYAGETDYDKFSLVGAFHYNEETGETARQQVDRFKQLVKRREILVVENSQGQEFLCDVNITNEAAPSLYVEKDMDYIEVTVECTEIDF